MRTDQKIFCLKTVLTIFLILLWLVGAVIFGILLWFLLDFWTTEYLELGAGLYRFQHLVYITISASAPIVAFSILGLIGGCLKKKWLMVVYLIAIVISILVTIGAGVYGIICRDELEQTVRRSDALTNLLKNNYDTYDRTSRITRAVDIMQNELECCGATDPIDWISTNWGQDESRKGQDFAPASCCKNYEYLEKNDFLCPIYEPEKDRVKSQDIWTNGCKDKLEEYFDKYIVVVIALASVFLFLELVCMVITSMYIHLLNSLYEAPHDDIVYDMAHNQEKSPYPSRGDYREYYH